jgi:dienelactone hydrolase
MYDWGEQGLGFVQEIQFVNRNGSTISGHVWAAFPRDGEATGRRPAISITNGSVQAPEELYWHAAQTLAQHGYVVLTWDPQGQGRSDAFGAGSTMFRGFPAQQAPNFFEGTEEALDFLLSTPDAPYEPRAAEGSNAEAAAKQERRVASGHADAYNPLHGIVDPERIGIAGHSLGASAVSQVGIDDPRVDAIVAWDNLRVPEEGSAPRVPALGISNDYGLTPTPFTEDPDPQGKNAAFAAYRAAGVDTMQVNIRGGTHYESSYIPNPAFGATLRGIDFVGWYTTAWFDKYVKGDATAGARLLSDRWIDDPREAEVDPSGDGNVFSSYFRSAVDIGGFECEDMRAGCGGALVPQADDGVDGEWSFLEERRP